MFNAEINFETHNYKKIKIEYVNLLEGTIHHPDYCRSRTIFQWCHSIKIKNGYLKCITNRRGESTEYERYGSNWPQSTENTYTVDLSCPYIKSIEIISEMN